MQRETVTNPDTEPIVAVPDAPPAEWAGPHPAPPVTVIRRSHGFLDLGVASLWAYRELLFFLIWRDVKVRYKQTAVGVLWVVLQPVATMLIFTFVFGHIAKLNTGTVPYPLFSYAGLLPWQLFASGLTGATAGVVANGGLISKVYFPRLIIPISTVIAGLVDFAISLLVLAGLMWYYHYTPGVEIAAIPLFILLAIATALAAGLWLSMLNVRFRDVQQTIPFLVQAWLFLTPVAYATTSLPLRFRALMGLNPMTSVVEGFRWAFVGGQGPFHATSFWLSLVMVAIVLVTGIYVFRANEKTFADLI